MQYQAISQPKLAGFDVIDFESASYDQPRVYHSQVNDVSASSAQQSTYQARPDAYPLQEAAVLVLLDLIRSGFSLSCGASWGKDSSCCVVLLIEAVRRAVAEGIYRAHYITTSSTGVENPAMENHAVRCQEEVQAYCVEHDLPIEVHTVYPSLASSFIVSTVGRGTLPRTSVIGKQRQCSVDWKVSPGQRLVTELTDRVQRENGRGLVTIIGTRLDESATRADRMTARGESATAPVRNSDGHLVLSPIAHWTLDDVWATISLIADPATSPYVPAISSESVERLFTLYRDANEGVCGVVLGDGGNRAPCSSRFGCHVCLIAGDKDKSMESMLENPVHAYMTPLNQFRNFLLASQFDFAVREMIGRTVSPAGFLAIGPDVYSLDFRKTMLWYLLSIDADERDRAERMEADIASGRIPDTPDNRMLSSPLFETVSLQQLAIVDFQWSMHAFAKHAFPALSIWYEVNHLGRRRRVPQQTTAPKINVPTKRWFDVGNLDKAAPSEGLRSHVDEIWNRYLHPDRPLSYREVDGSRTVWFEEDDNLSVDAAAACEFITCTYPSMVVDTRGMPAIESARWWLNQELVRLPKGQAGRYQNIAKRNQYFANLATRLDLSPQELVRYLLDHSITNAQHEALLPKPPASLQLDMFSMLQAA